jgi:hypothetical protein
LDKKKELSICFLRALPLPWAAISRNATNATMWTNLTTRAVTGIVQRASKKTNWSGSTSGGELEFKGRLVPNGEKGKFSSLTNLLYKKEWVVNIQAPLGKPEKILEYLSRYVFRIAITDRRILELKNGKVIFWWKDYRTYQFRKMKLDTDEFIRRFLLHVLPKGIF